MVILHAQQAFKNAWSVLKMFENAWKRVWSSQVSTYPLCLLPKTIDRLLLLL